MAFKLEAQETFLKGIPRIARERIDRVIESLSGKTRPGPESIHEARKDLKSLRALLRLARGAIDDEIRIHENIFFRDAGRSLSAVRDPQALLEALKYFDKQLPSSSGLSRSKSESIRAFIEKIRLKLNQNLIDGLPPGTLRKLLRDLRAARRRFALLFESASLRPGNEWEVFIGNGLRRTYRKAKNIVWQFEVIGHETAEDNTWHELRKCAKALGYQLRLLKPVWPGMMHAFTEEIDQLTDRLGDANDLAVLRDKILDEPYDRSDTLTYGETRRIFLQSLDQRKQMLQLEAFNLARFIYAKKPGQFERGLREYWQIWRLLSDAKDLKTSGRIARQADRLRQPITS